VQFVAPGDGRYNDGGDGSARSVGYGLGLYGSGPLPHSVPVSGAYGAHDAFIEVAPPPDRRSASASERGTVQQRTERRGAGQGERDKGLPRGVQLQAALGTVIDDDHVGGVQERPARAFCLEAVRGGNLETWAAPLVGGRFAVALLNRSPEAEAEAEVLWKDLESLGVAGDAVFAVRDVWAKLDVAPRPVGYTTSVPAHGAVLLVLSPEDGKGAEEDGAGAGP
jgi:hypothetical protein